MSKNHLDYTAILTTYNAEKTVSDSLHAILNQSIHPFEIIVIDDASSDSTQTLLNLMIKEKKQRITLVCNSRNQGQSYSRNLGARLSTRSKLIFFDDDDISHPERAKEHLLMLRESVHLSFVSSKKIYDSGYEVLFNNRNVVKLSLESKTWARKLILGKNQEGLDKLWVPASTLGVDKDFFLLIGGFSGEFRRLEDADLVLKSTKYNAIASWSDLCLVNRLSTNSNDKGGEIESKYEKKLLDKYKYLLEVKEYRESSELIRIREAYFQKNYFVFLIRIILNPWIVRSSFKRIHRFYQRLLHDFRKAK